MCVATATALSIAGAIGTAGTAYAATRAQSKSSQRALNYQQQADTTAMDWEQQQEAQRQAEQARVAEEEKRRWEVDEANRQKQFEISEQERLRIIERDKMDRERAMESDRLNRERQAKLDAMSEEDRRIEQQRYADAEARKAPYRQASQSALLRLQDLITAPGAGTSPAAHQFSRPSNGMTMGALVGR